MHVQDRVFERLKPSRELKDRDDGILVQPVAERFDLFLKPLNHIGCAVQPLLRIVDLELLLGLLASRSFRESFSDGDSACLADAKLGYWHLPWRYKG